MLRKKRDNKDSLEDIRREDGDVVHTFVAIIKNTVTGNYRIKYFDDIVSMA